MNGFLDDPTGYRPEIGRGEAQLLTPPKSFDWDRFFDLKRQNEAIKRHAQEKSAALLTDDIKADWATDMVDYIQPKQEAIKQKFKGWASKQNGVLTPAQQFEIQRDKEKVKNEVHLDNELKKSYIDKVKKLDVDEGKDWDRERSIQVLQAWNDPYSVPEFKEDIIENYGGNKVKWRAANEHNFQLIPNYNEDKYFADLTKDEKAVPFQEKDKDGNIVYKKHPTGQYYYMEGKKLSPEQVGGLTNRVLAGTGYKDQRTKELAAEKVDNTLSITEDGVVGIPANLDPNQKALFQRAITNAGNTQGLTRDEIRRKLVSGYIAAQIETRNGQDLSPHEIPFTPKVATPKEPAVTTTIATHYNNIANKIQQNPNLTPEQVATEFGGAPRVNKATGEYVVDLPVPPNVKPFVAVPAGSILVQQKGMFGPKGKYAPNKAGRGEVAGTVANTQIMWKKDGVTVTPDTPGAEAYGQITYNTVNASDADLQDDDKFNALFEAFKQSNPTVTKEVYKQMLENGKNVGENFKREYKLSDPVQRTYYDQVMGGTSLSQTSFNKEVKASRAGQPAQPAKTVATPAKTKTVPLSKIKALVGTKGYEGYSEKELVDYYKSQGYTFK